jgi:hypothetical protein
VRNCILRAGAFDGLTIALAAASDVRPASRTGVRHMKKLKASRSPSISSSFWATSR